MEMTLGSIQIMEMTLGSIQIMEMTLGSIQIMEMTLGRIQIMMFVLWTVGTELLVRQGHNTIKRIECFFKDIFDMIWMDIVRIYKGPG
jgi:hypothetical protein